MGMAGIPWWTSDIGGFLGGQVDDPAFRELLVRWFQWACFCPVFRMHGERSPWYERDQEYIGDVRQLTSGQSNEVWSFGDEVYDILRKYLFVRERMRPYIREVMRAAHEHGDPVMRPLFYGFPADKAAWSVEDAYLFGADVLVAPVLERAQGCATCICRGRGLDGCRDGRGIRRRTDRAHGCAAGHHARADSEGQRGQGVFGRLILIYEGAHVRINAHAPLFIWLLLILIRF